jgi:hypothetical protein
MAVRCLRNGASLFIGRRGGGKLPGQSDRKVSLARNTVLSGLKKNTAYEYSDDSGAAISANLDFRLVTVHYDLMRLTEKQRAEILRTAAEVFGTGDRRIDVVLRTPDSEDRTIHRIASSEGVMIR